MIDIKRFPHWVLATHNRGKIDEMRACLQGRVALSDAGSLGVSEPDETGLSYLENALLKARHACRATGYPALADDSGLEVDALAGRPGIYSARYADNFQDSIARVLDEMQGQSNRRARFVCVMVWMAHAEDPRPRIFQGLLEGEVTDAPCGALGFGYDPIVRLPDGRTVAELSQAEKNRISHRAKAMKALLRACDGSATTG